MTATPKSPDTSRDPFCEAARDIDFKVRESSVAILAAAAAIPASLGAVWVTALLTPAVTIAAGAATMVAVPAGALYINNAIEERERRTPARPPEGFSCAEHFVRAANGVLHDADLTVLIGKSADQYPEVQKAMNLKTPPSGLDDIRITTEISPDRRVRFVLPAAPGLH